MTLARRYDAGGAVLDCEQSAGAVAAYMAEVLSSPERDWVDITAARRFMQRLSQRPPDINHKGGDADADQA